MPADPFEGAGGPDPLVDGELLEAALLDAALRTGLGPLAGALRALDESDLRAIVLGRVLRNAAMVEEALEARRAPAGRGSRVRRLPGAVRASWRAFRRELT